MGIFHEITIAPRQRMFAEQINRLLPEMGIKATIAFEPLNTTASEKESEKFERLVNAGILDANEARVELGWPEREETQGLQEAGREQIEEVAKRGERLLLRKLEAVREAL